MWGGGEQVHLHILTSAVSENERFNFIPWPLFAEEAIPANTE
jgi:hypothetical protein